MTHSQHTMLHMLLVAGLISLLAACTGQPSNSQFTLRVSGDRTDLAFEGQCTSQQAGFWPGSTKAQGLEVEGTIDSVSQPEEFETSGFFIYCAVENQSATGAITIELLQDGTVVASAQSTAPDAPATVEFGQKP